MKKSQSSQQQQKSALPSQINTSADEELDISRYDLFKDADNSSILNNTETLFERDTDVNVNAESDSKLTLWNDPDGEENQNVSAKLNDKDIKTAKDKDDLDVYFDAEVWTDEQEEKLSQQLNNVKEKEITSTELGSLPPKQNGAEQTKDSSAISSITTSSAQAMVSEDIKQTQPSNETRATKGWWATFTSLLTTQTNEAPNQTNMLEIDKPLDMPGAYYEENPSPSKPASQEVKVDPSDPNKEERERKAKENVIQPSDWQELLKLVGKGPSPAVLPIGTIKEPVKPEAQVHHFQDGGYYAELEPTDSGIRRFASADSVEKINKAKTVNAMPTERKVKAATNENTNDENEIKSSRNRKK
jgi:hypothetical protein